MRAPCRALLTSGALTVAFLLGSGRPVRAQSRSAPPTDDEQAAEDWQTYGIDLFGWSLGAMIALAIILWFCMCVGCCFSCCCSSRAERLREKAAKRLADRQAHGPNSNDEAVEDLYKDAQRDTCFKKNGRCRCFPTRFSMISTSLVLLNVGFCLMIYVGMQDAFDSGNETYDGAIDTVLDIAEAACSREKHEQCDSGVGQFLVQAMNVTNATSEELVIFFEQVNSVPDSVLESLDNTTEVYGDVQVMDRQANYIDQNVSDIDSLVDDVEAEDAAVAAQLPSFSELPDVTDDDLATLSLGEVTAQESVNQLTDVLNVTKQVISNDDTVSSLVYMFDGTTADDDNDDSRLAVLDQIKDILSGFRDMRDSMVDAHDQLDEVRRNEQYENAQDYVPVALAAFYFLPGLLLSLALLVVCCCNDRKAMAGSQTEAAVNAAAAADPVEAERGTGDAKHKKKKGHCGARCSACCLVCDMQFLCWTVLFFCVLPGFILLFTYIGNDTCDYYVDFMELGLDYNLTIGDSEVNMVADGTLDDLLHCSGKENFADLLGVSDEFDMSDELEDAFDDIDKLSDDLTEPLDDMSQTEESSVDISAAIDVDFINDDTVWYLNVYHANVTDLLAGQTDPEIIDDLNAILAALVNVNNSVHTYEAAQEDAGNIFPSTAEQYDEIERLLNMSSAERALEELVDFVATAPQYLGCSWFGNFFQDVLENSFCDDFVVDVETVAAGMILVCILILTMFCFLGYYWPMLVGKDAKPAVRSAVDSNMVSLHTKAVSQDRTNPQMPVPTHALPDPQLLALAQPTAPGSVLGSPMGVESAPAPSASREGATRYPTSTQGYQQSMNQAMAQGGYEMTVHSAARGGGKKQTEYRFD